MNEGARDNRENVWRLKEYKYKYAVLSEEENEGLGGGRGMTGRSI
jgi:hypothetical protein